MLFSLHFQKLSRGKGKFKEQFFCFLLYAMPLLVIIFVLTDFLIYSGAPAPLWIVPVIYALLLLCGAALCIPMVMGVHILSWEKAVLAVLLSVLVLVLLSISITWLIGSLTAT
jgi:uncharacterized membrane protein